MTEPLFCFDDDQCQLLAQEYGTPLFAYSEASATRNYHGLRAALPKRVRIAYAVKANPLPPLLRHFASLGAGFDCASLGELQRVAELEMPDLQILFAGPGKRRAEIEYALQIGARMNAESFEDLWIVNELATRPTAVNLRIHPSFGTEDGGRIIGGSGPSAFGVDEEDVIEFLQQSRMLDNVQIRGLHVFIASNQLSADNLLSIYRQVFSLAQRLEQDLSSPLDLIDLGGGLGVPYGEGEVPLDISALGKGLEILLKENGWFEGELVLEPGRYLAASAGVYLSRVVRLKESRGELFAILEGGINHLLRPYLTGQSFPVRAVGLAGGLVEVSLAGPLCTSLDRLGSAILPALAPGDLLVFGMVGAYGLTEGMTHFLSHAVPSEIWVSGQS